MRVLWQSGAPVQSLAFDDPWLAAALGDGSTLLVNADAALRGACLGAPAASADSSSGRGARDARARRASPP